MPRVAKTGELENDAKVFASVKAPASAKPAGAQKTPEISNVFEFLS